MTDDAIDLDLNQRAAVTSGADMWSTTAVPGIPSIVLSDGPHGLRHQTADGDSLGLGSSVPATCFPPAAGLASSWNDDLVERVGAQLGREAIALGVSVLLGPGINIKRSPLCGRNFEYASEDPLVSGRYGTAFVRGVQSQGVGATPKHFAVNNQETDRFRVSAEVDERALREIYLPAFERVVHQAHPWAFMCAYNRVSGVYAAQHRRLLTEILRAEWGFDGLVVSDWGAVGDRVASLAAGLDLEMPPSGTDDEIVTAVRRGTLTEAELDRTVDRLRVLVRRTASARAERPGELDAEAGDRLAVAAARESVVLLRNDGALPLDSSAPGAIGVIGAFAAEPRFQGGGSSRVVPARLHVPLTELRDRFGGERVRYAPGFRLDSEPDQQLTDDAVAIARDCAAVVAFVGLPESAESEGFDRTTLELPAPQRVLLHRLATLDVPVVVVVSSGGVVELGAWREHVSAILYGWLLGQGGGRAIADLLTGDAAPSGRLTETIPRALADTPSHVHFPGRDGVAHYGESIFVGYRWYDTLGVPVAYPFGHGLTYTEFTYGDLRVDETATNTYTVRCTVTNTGSRPGAAVPQLYVRNEAGSRPLHELRDYTKVELDPGRSHEVTLHLRPRDFALWDVAAERWRVDPGTYVLELGESSRDIRSTATVSSPGDGWVGALDGSSTIAEWLAHPVGQSLTAPLLEAVAEELGGQPAPELAAMMMQVPLAKVATLSGLVTPAQVREMVDAVARHVPG